MNRRASVLPIQWREFSNSQSEILIKKISKYKCHKVASTQNSFAVMFPACSSLVEGEYVCIGPSGNKLLYLRQTPKDYAARAWQHTIHV